MKKSERLITMAAIVLFALTLLLPMQSQAAPKLSKRKITLTVGKSTTIKVKNAKGKVRWQSSRKKVITVKKTSLKKAKIIAKKKGQAKITAIVGKKKLVCRVIVKPKKKADGSQKPDNEKPGKDSSSLKAPKLKKIDLLEDSVRIYWSHVNGATGYEILRKDTGNWAVIAIVKKNTFSYTDTMVKPGVTYSYTVRALNRTKKGRYDAAGIQAIVPAKPDGETGETGSDGVSSSGETDPETETKIPETEPETEGKIYMDRYERYIGSYSRCGWGDYNSFHPMFLKKSWSAEEATAWIAELNGEEKAFVEESIQKSNYNEEFKNELIDILYQRISLTDEYKEELETNQKTDFSNHGFSNNHGNSSVLSVYFYGPWVEIPESEYEQWKKNNKK